MTDEQTTEAKVRRALAAAPAPETDTIAELDSLLDGRERLRDFFATVGFDPDDVDIVDETTTAWAGYEALVVVDGWLPVKFYSGNDGVLAAALTGGKSERDGVRLVNRKARPISSKATSVGEMTALVMLARSRTRRCRRASRTLRR